MKGAKLTPVHCFVTLSHSRVVHKCKFASFAHIILPCVYCDYSLPHRKKKVQKLNNNSGEERCKRTGRSSSERSGGWRWLCTKSRAPVKTSGEPWYWYGEVTPYRCSCSPAELCTLWVMFAECVMKMSQSAKSAQKHKDTVARTFHPSKQSQDSGFTLLYTTTNPKIVTLVLNWMFPIEDTKATNHIDSGLSQKCVVLSPISEATAPEIRCNSNECCTEIHNIFASRYWSEIWPLGSDLIPLWTLFTPP